MGLSSILIIKTSSLGDVVCALPVLTALRQLYPQARIGWVIDHRFADLLAHHPWIDELFVFRWHRVCAGREGWEALRALWGELQGVGQRLRKQGWEAAVDLQSVLKSAVILRASGARLRIAEFAGLRHWASLWAANRLVYARRPHEVERCLEVAGPLGVRLGPPRFCLHIPAEARAWAAQQLSGRPRPRLAINLGSARPEKRWPPENFAAVVAGLKAALGETTVILTGTQAEGQVAEAVAQAAPESCLTLAGQTTLPQLAAVLEACDLLLTADSGPMHMMAALGKPVIALFGPTDPRRNGPWGDQHKVLCAPDGRMTSLSAQTVLAALLEQWAAVRPG